MSRISSAARARESENVERQAKRVGGQRTSRKALSNLTNKSVTSKAASKTDIKSTVGKSSKGEKYVAVMEEEEYMEKEYMPKDIPSKDLDFTSEFVPSSYFNDLLSSLKSTRIAAQPKQPTSLTCRLDTEYRPGYCGGGFPPAFELDLDLPDLPDFPDIPD